MKDIYKKKAVVFAIVAVLIASISTVSLADWTPGDGHKMHYPQLPDEAGWDVYATAGLAQYGYPEICLADDWNCSESGHVTDIHFWGSWKNGREGNILAFVIAIAEDIPASENPDGYSKPGTTLWERTFEFWDAVAIDPPSMEGWYNPYTGEVIYDDHNNYFQYNIVDIPGPFYQIEGTIYWLSISAIVEYEPIGLQPLWGWKSSMDHWNDDACWAEWYYLDWIDIWEPSLPVKNQYWIAMDPSGQPDPWYTGGTDYYNETGTPINGWYYYPQTDWWNIWFYDHPFDETRMKEIFTSFSIRKYNPDVLSYVEVAVNWATDYWDPGGPPPVPPIENEELYIGRAIIFGGQNMEGFYEFFYEILDYNPEWVSIDVRGYNFIIENGWIEHACLGSLDLAFVITGEQPGEANVEIEKTVWDPDLQEWVEEINAAVGEQVSFQIEVHNNGSYNLANIVVTDTLPVCLEYVSGSADPDPTSVHGNIITWNFPGPLSYCETRTITFDADVVSEGENINVATVTADADDGTVVTAQDTATVNAYDPGDWYWKPDYPNYAPHTPGGMPDFSQYQDQWQRIDPGPNGILESTAVVDDVNNGINIAPGPNCHLDTQPSGDDVVKWAFCGPVAVANCFWWFDSKYADPTGWPGDGADVFPLVEDYGVGDDHSSANVPYLIEDLADKMGTCQNGTTHINDMQNAIDQWFIDKNLGQMFTETTYDAPRFDFIEAEIERSQDVILLLGFYDSEFYKLVDQEQTLYDTCVDIPPHFPGHVQSFIPTVSVLDAVQLLFQCNYPDPSTVDVTIYDRLPTLPGAMPLGTSSMVISGGVWEPATWYQFHFDPSIMLTPGLTYFIAVQSYNMDYNIHWCYNTNVNGDSYPQGMAYFSWIVGSLEPSDYDFAFKTEYYGGDEECVRKDGHYVTCAGVNSDAFKIAFSDPALDIYDSTPTDHNDAQYVSHDIYNVVTGSPCVGLPYLWWLPDYPSGHMYTIVEQAVVICPQPSIEVDKLVWNTDIQEWVEEIDAEVGSTVTFKIDVHNNGGYDLTNIVVTDTLPVCLEYIDRSADPDPTSVHGNIITWNFPGPLSYCETRTITFDAKVISEGENINVVDVSAEAYPYPGDPVIVMDVDTAIVNGFITQIPSVDIEKWVWDEVRQEWVDEINADVCTIVRFRIDVHNDGDYDLFNIIVNDMLPICLEYADNGTVNGIPREPDDISGNMLIWHFPGPLHYCEHIIIEFDAHVIFEGTNINEACVDADSIGGHVFDCDTATVVVGLPPQFIEITTLSYKWNMIAVPFDYSVDKADIIVEYAGTDYTWADAVAAGIIADAIYNLTYLNQDVDIGYGHTMTVP